MLGTVLGLRPPTGRVYYLSYSLQYPGILQDTPKSLLCDIYIYDICDIYIPQSVLRISQYSKDCTPKYKNSQPSTSRILQYTIDFMTSYSQYPESPSIPRISTQHKLLIPKQESYPNTSRTATLYEEFLPNITGILSL